MFLIFVLPVEGCDLSCNVHTGVRIAPITLVQEDLRLRHIKYGNMTDGAKRHTLEMQLREEEEYLKLQMYLRDDRFAQSLQNDPQHHNKFYKTIIDVLHMPMRTNEKVLTLLYEEVTQGAHKAQATSELCDLTPIIRRLGELGKRWHINLKKRILKQSRSSSFRTISLGIFLPSTSFLGCA
jgi:hypothetical protein